ncbi:MAG: GGDEF domain-containing protein [Natronospirillum sp.]|uniref:GGDEF domain-containing protein n=1 Tax=Natronospirillum sp. TaxID=2812955 RepID=UPI0025D14682|nr:GGDEF domain-containing protein [Natronospirillum sp.]MCH8551465.1 GGDEF domain-containing protein [Natronospirillum sp.]
MAERNVTKKDISKAQRLRLQRTMWACVPLAVLLCCVLIYVQHDIVPADRAIEYLLIIVIAWTVFFGLILSGLNLRLPDPSMTVAQIFTGIFSQLYIMFFLNDPLARVPFLLLGTVNMMFAVFALGLWRMLAVNVLGVGAYAGMVLLKAQWYPAGMADWRVEALTILAFVVAVSMNTYIGSVITGLRDKLRSRNKELEKAMVRLEDLATQDPLTRLPNRRSVMDQMAREHARLEEPGEGGHLSLCMLDVDYFKAINDNHGHHCGDEVLRWLGEVLDEQLDDRHFVGRFGGEEFLLLLPGQSLVSATKKLDQIREVIAATSPKGLPAGESITISAGVAEHQTGTDIQDTLRRADEALYRAKAAGRNCIQAADSVA